MALEVAVRFGTAKVVTIFIRAKLFEIFFAFITTLLQILPVETVFHPLEEVAVISARVRFEGI